MVFYGTYSAALCESETELAAVGRLRYEAYRSVDLIPPNAEASFLDAYDRSGNSRSLLISEGGAPVASIRASIHAEECGFAPIPALEAYREDLIRHVGGPDKTISDALWDGEYGGEYVEIDTNVTLEELFEIMHTSRVWTHNLIQ